MIDLTTAELDFKPCRKRPLVVEAIQIHEPFTVKTLEGDMQGQAGDYLMRGVNGERYPCAREIFEKSYLWGEPDFLLDSFSQIVKTNDALKLENNVLLEENRKLRRALNIARQEESTVHRAMKDGGWIKTILDSFDFEKVLAATNPEFGAIFRVTASELLHMVAVSPYVSQTLRRNGFVAEKQANCLRLSFVLEEKEAGEF